MCCRDTFTFGGSGRSCSDGSLSRGPNQSNSWSVIFEKPLDVTQEKAQILKESCSAVNCISDFAVAISTSLAPYPQQTSALDRHTGSISDRAPHFCCCEIILLSAISRTLAKKETHVPAHPHSASHSPHTGLEKYHLLCQYQQETEPTAECYNGNTVSLNVLQERNWTKPSTPTLCAPVRYFALWALLPLIPSKDSHSASIFLFILLLHFLLTVTATRVWFVVI